MPTINLFIGDNLPILESMDSESVDMCYIDPPYNTGKQQGSEPGLIFDDYFDTIPEYLDFLWLRLEQIERILKPNGNFVMHIDYRCSHHIRLMLDKVFDSECLNEIVWAYDFGGRSKRKFPAKHDTLYWYSKGEAYTFNRDAVDKIPYLAPGLVGKEKAERGKYVTDVWWHTIVGTQAKERTKYPTQKPLGILNRLILALSNSGDTVLDCFAGSGTTGVSAVNNGRHAILIDQNPAVADIIRERVQNHPESSLFNEVEVIIHENLGSTSV